MIRKRTLKAGEGERNTFSRRSWDTLRRCRVDLRHSKINEFHYVAIHWHHVVQRLEISMYYAGDAWVQHIHTNCCLLGQPVCSVLVHLYCCFPLVPLTLSLFSMFSSMVEQQWEWCELCLDIPESYIPINFQVWVQPLVQAPSLHVLHDNPELPFLKEACPKDCEDVWVSQLGENVWLKSNVMIMMQKEAQQTQTGRDNYMTNI